MSVDDVAMKVLKREVEFLKDDIIKAYDEKGMRASGNFARSLTVMRRIFTVELWGVHYSRYLETGRKAGGMPPVERIKDWIIQKRIIANIPTDRLAWAIAKKIEKKGWDRALYGGVDLFSETITPDRVEQIADKVGEAIFMQTASWWSLLDDNN